MTFYKKNELGNDKTIQIKIGLSAVQKGRERRIFCQDIEQIEIARAIWAQISQFERNTK